MKYIGKQSKEGVECFAERKSFGNHSLLKPVAKERKKDSNLYSLESSLVENGRGFIEMIRCLIS